MRDLEILKLAKNIVHYSCGIKTGEKVLIESTDASDDLVIALIKEVYAVGGLPFVNLYKDEIKRALLYSTSEKQCALMAEYVRPTMLSIDAYIGIHGGYNLYELSDVKRENIELYNLYYSGPIHRDIRVEKKKWVILRYPTPAMAERAGVSTEAFEKFYFDVCNLDYKKMGRALKVLREVMQRTDKIHILAPETDLRMSIRGIKAIPCTGKANIPDGEIYSAPIKDSVNGTILFNVPTLFDGVKHEKVKLTFENGKVVKAQSSFTNKLNNVLDIDEGARYLGEFAFGVNPYINMPIFDTLFDEKMMGSIHMALGCCYKNAYNANKSAIHWDLIQLQTKEAGGGKVYFDDVLIREDGMFVPENLKILNPENLK